MKNRRLLLLTALLAAIVGLSLYLTPETRVERYVAAHRETLQADMDAYFLRGEPLRYDAPLETVNCWPGEHPMVEYVLPALRPALRLPRPQGRLGSGGGLHSGHKVPALLLGNDVPLRRKLIIGALHRGHRHLKVPGQRPLGGELFPAASVPEKISPLMQRYK